VRKQAMFWVGGRMIRERSSFLKSCCTRERARNFKIRERKAPGFFVSTAVRIRSVARTA
jgi:hypothetical protein